MHMGKVWKRPPPSPPAQTSYQIGRSGRAKPPAEAHVEPRLAKQNILHCTVDSHASLNGKPLEESSDDYSVLDVTYSLPDDDEYTYVPTPADQIPSMASGTGTGGHDMDEDPTPSLRAINCLLHCRFTYFIKRQAFRGVIRRLLRPRSDVFAPRRR